jgi:hypothetical protein
MPYVGQTPLEERLDDVREVIRMVGKSIEEGKADKGAVLDNLFIAMQKIENIKSSIRKK